MKHKEEEILRLIQDPATKRQGFSFVVETYSEQLYWLIRGMVIGHDDANDVLQNTLLKVWTSLDSFRGDSKIYTWMYKIATNECFAFLQKQKRMQSVSIDDDESYEVAKNLEGDEYFDGDEAQRILQEAVSTLPPKQRLVFNMKYFEEKKYEEISEILGTTVGALKASFHHAVKKIENYVEKHTFN